MSGFSVPISTAVKRLRGKIDFLQPLFEAVSNSLEANARNIKVKISVDRSSIIPEGRYNKVDGFIVEDDGDGFNNKNIKSFLTYMSDYKIDLGCKGIGRITWLKVFSDVYIESRVEGEKVAFKFNEGFSEKNVIRSSVQGNASRKTTIIFSNVKASYFERGRYDLRAEANVNELRSAVEEHLLVKLSLLKINKLKFNILIYVDKDESAASITNDSLVDLKEKDFVVAGQDKADHLFKLFYGFYYDHNRQKKAAYFCANGRTVRPIPDKVSYSSLPDGTSSVVLLTSEYFDAHVNDERTGFDIPESGVSLTSDLSWERIYENLQYKIDEILLEYYPKLKEENKQTVADLIDEYPYLAKYIKQDKSKIKDKNKILKASKKEYEQDKENTSLKFKKLLDENNIDSDVFYKTMEQVQDMSARELAEYIVYRRQIITALGKMNDAGEKRESLLHNLFMKMRTDSHKESREVYDNNLWLLDDKYMTYVYAASDKTIASIQGAIEKESEDVFNVKVRPDLAIFYSHNGSTRARDAVVVEFKGIGSGLDEKSKSFWEINRNVEAIREGLTNIDRIWAYAITKFDDKFIKNIRSQDYKPLFSNSNPGGVYYRYFTAIDAHCYYISVDAIISDAEARNNIFLEIIKTAN